MKKLHSYSAKPNSSIAWSVNITFKHLHQLVFVLFKHAEHQHFITLYGRVIWKQPGSITVYFCVHCDLNQDKHLHLYSGWHSWTWCLKKLNLKWVVVCNQRPLVWSTRELRLIQSLRSCCRKMRHRFRLPEVLICHRRRNTSVTNNKPDGTIAETKVKLKHVEVRFSLFIHFHSPHLCFHHWVVFISVKFT